MKKIILAFSFLLISTPCCIAQNKTAAVANGTASVKVMILGTFHFNGAPAFNDIMAKNQQKEIQAVVDSLADFGPNKIIVEEIPEDMSQLNRIYDAYRAGRHQLTRNEIQQLGFRLAARLGHNKIYGIDYKQDWPMDKVLSYAKKYAPSFVTYWKEWQQRIKADTDSLHRNGTIAEILHWLNEPSVFSRIQKLRMRTLAVGADSNHVGVKPVLSMYKRDMHIFANLTAIAEPGDRIIVIYGVSHAYNLRDFVRHHPNMELIDPLNYL